LYPMVSINPDFERGLLEALRTAIDRDIVPKIQDLTRVDTGALRDSTTTMFEGDRLLILQGGTFECNYAIWIELKYGEFSTAISLVDWDFKAG
jgi:hypothetical protein